MKHKHTTRLFSLLPALGVTAFSASLAHPAHAELLIRSGDRVVFYGDSITEGHNYTRPLQSYIYERYPSLKVSFFNAGWGGDQASGALRRLDRDVLALRPNLVTLCFGMNDGHYTKVNDEIVKAYHDNMDGIVAALRARNVRVVVFSPPCVDYDKRADLKPADYNKNLEALATAASEVARKHGCKYFDILHPMLEAQTALKARDAAFTMIPDGIHPNEDGGVVMAGLMLKGLGADPMPLLADIAAPAATSSTPSVVGASYTFTLPQPVNVPLWMGPNAVAPAEASGVLGLVGQTLRVRNLPASTYAVKIGNASVGEWTSAQLAAGILIPGTYSARARQLWDVTHWKEQQYFNTWRNLRIGREQGAVTEAAVAGLMRADEGFNSAIESLRAPIRGLTISLQSSSLPAGLGPNLALRKSYEASDPNVYNFGIGGLTDGSWEAGDRHIFATGDKDTFPKTATIDLDQPATISHVRIGVPPFGSTKTIEVLVSTDGQNFKSVGRYAFTQGNEEKHIFAFAPTNARYVRLSYPDHFPNEAGYTPTFAFTSEVEVYGPQH